MSDLSSYIVNEIREKVSDLYMQGVVDGITNIKRAIISLGTESVSVKDIKEACDQYIKDFKQGNLDFDKEDDEPIIQNNNETVNNPEPVQPTTENTPSKERCADFGMSDSAFDALMNSMNNPIPDQPIMENTPEVIDGDIGNAIEVPNEVCDEDSDN